MSRCTYSAHLFEELVPAGEVQVARVRHVPDSRQLTTSRRHWPTIRRFCHELGTHGSKTIDDVEKALVRVRPGHNRLAVCGQRLQLSELAGLPIRRPKDYW